MRAWAQVAVKHRLEVVAFEDVDEQVRKTREWYVRPLGGD